jgi:hypothetical protein
LTGSISIQAAQPLELAVALVDLTLDGVPANVQLYAQDPAPVDVLLMEAPGIIIEFAEGVPGPQGLPGSSAAYEFTQSTPANPWTVNHNRGTRLVTTVYDTGGQEVEAHVVHTSLNQLMVYFDTPMAGFLRAQ